MIQVWVPAQSNSTRVENKNTRDFVNGKSLLEIKLEQVSKAVAVEDIYVSGNSSETEEIVTRIGANYIHRPQELLGNEISQKMLFQHFFDNTPTSDYVLWVQVTDPFFDDFKGLCAEAPPRAYESIVVASTLRKHAFYKEDPINFCFGGWHKVTQDITPLVVPRWSAFMHERETLREVLYHFGYNIRWYFTDDPLIDIDTLTDFKLARILYSDKINERF
jgi:N-acylneuraminate cytidylyltransferase